ncbi:MAG: acetyl/propionyl/methylcrotonyl-CoA carboxylase subunit alpha [Pseudomonadota bacterium]|jgi:acetyl/propionyl-CoA carboxylase alpha subunit
MINAKQPIRRILIANRGEIARRIIRTCRVLDIETVAVYSEVDAHSPHVREASFSECIGGPMAYLSVEAIVDAALRSGADSVHPGYGFLSENPALPEALASSGVTFIGPSAQTIRELGSKTNAKAIAARANVPVAPTLLLTGDSFEAHIERLREFTSKVEFPVIIKAAAGGGGRGMRLVNSLEQCPEALESAARESLKAFGSSEIFVEKYISPARHIEVQIAGDIHGRVVALGTRDCSLQRSNQKIIEEAPALDLKAGVSEEICQAAARLAKEVGYCNLGTVEFLYSQDGSFYFLEVNTRLQVEHPVTEMTTGFDLVKLQIDIASGQSLDQMLGSCDTPRPIGHSIEARLCAEEYTGKFTATTGIILDMHIPRGPSDSGLIRADMGYEVCSEVSHHYDSLLGKIIVHAPDRSQAIQLLQNALSATQISGVGTNRSLLTHLITTDAFRELKHTVQGTAKLLPSTEELHDQWVTGHAIIAAARIISHDSRWLLDSPWTDSDKTLASHIRYPFTTSVHSLLINSEAYYEDSGILVCFSAPYQREIFIRLSPSNEHDESAGPALRRFSASIDRSAAVPVAIVHDGDNTWIHTKSSSTNHLTVHSRARTLAGDNTAGELAITSPIPGKVATINISQGDRVQAGDLLIVLDSMKMEHPFRAPRDGVVASVEVSKGALVNAGATLIVITS